MGCGTVSQAALIEGIQLGSMRVVYPEANKNGTKFSLMNTSKNTFLMQSWIRMLDGEDKAPFIVLPPLKRVDPQERLNLRILRTGGNLPEDRESVFYLTMRAVPTISAKQEGTGVVTLVLQNSIKLFYRPQGLPKDGINAVAHKLQFTRNGNQLTAINPSPFYLTLSHLAVGPYLLDKDKLQLMVPPKGQQSWQIPSSARGEVRWKLIDEMGESTQEQRQL
ncbi:hypothetical protein WN53_18160 [Serratia fonticola]|nr:hypothetical protein WN53_18160 [Serratia fonticola]